MSDAANDMPTRLRWGIASTGKIAAAMAQALGTLPDAEIVAVGSRTQAAADGFAERFGIPRAHGSSEALWADPDVDIVYIASPHSHHREMTVAALAAGKHVLCEKAFALNAAEARTMIDAARRADRFLMEAMWTWFIPAVVELRRRVADGVVGELKVVDANFAIPIATPDGRHRRADLAGGALLDLGIYPITFARHLAGAGSGSPAAAVESVAATGVLGPTGVDAVLGGAVRFEGGSLGVFHTSLDVRSNGRATVYGTEGRIDVDPPFWNPTTFTVRRDGADAERVEIPHHGLAHEAAHAMERIRGGHLESDVIPLDVTESTMVLLDEIRRQVGVVYPSEAE
jgi:predicted dehydrogenase